LNFSRLAKLPGLWETVPMLKRNLRIVKRVRNAPVLGICEYCNMQFSADPIGQPSDAQAAIQQQFNAHKCKPEDASQTAARIVRENTESKS
jgi:hypothetical protein